MEPSSKMIETAVTELLLDTGQLTRRLCAESSSLEFSWSQVAIMAPLESGGALTIVELARVESVKPQSMGSTIAVMEQGGLVERRPHPTDGRQVLFTLDFGWHRGEASTGTDETRVAVRCDRET